MNKEYDIDDILLDIKAKKSKQGVPPVNFPVKNSAKTEFSEKQNLAPDIQQNLIQEKISSEEIKFEEKVQEKKDDLFSAFNFNLDDAPKFTPQKEEKTESFSFEKNSSFSETSKQREYFKVTLPEENSEENLDYSKYFNNLKEEPKTKEEPKIKTEFKFKINSSENAESEGGFQFKDNSSEPPKEKNQGFNFNFNIKEDTSVTPVVQQETAAPKITFDLDEEATREVSLGKDFHNKANVPDFSAPKTVKPAEQPVEKPKKAPFKLDLDFDKDIPDEPVKPAQKKSIFPDEMMNEKPKRSLFGKKNKNDNSSDEEFKEAFTPKNQKPVFYEENDDVDEDESDVDDYSSSADKESVIHDMKVIKTGLLIRLVLMIVLFGTSLYLTMSLTNPNLDLPAFMHPETKLRNFMIVNTAVVGIAALICSNTFGGGLISLLKLRADCDALPAMSVAAVLAQGVCFIIKPSLLQMNIQSTTQNDYTITAAVSLFFPVAILILLFNIIGKIMTILRIQNNFKMVASDRMKYSLNMLENKALLNEWTATFDMEEYLVAYPVKTRFLSRFLEYSYSEDYAENMSVTLAPVSILAAAFISVLSYVFNEDISVAISTFAATLCICTPLTSTIAANWPMLRLSNKLTPIGAMVAGYESINTFAETEGIVVKANDIFPSENVTLHAIKPFDQSKIDSVILDAASVVCSTKGILSGVFLQIIGADKNLLRPVENVTYEDCMGLSAWVDGKRVLVGNRELMIHHGVSVPSMDYEKRYVKDSKNIIYLSNSGELSAMFVISYNANEEVTAQLDKLADNGMFLIVETSDPNITAEKIHQAYEFPLEQIKIMPAKNSGQYRSMTDEKPSAPAHIGYIGGAKTMIRTICDCMTVKASIAQGVVIQMASLIIGYGIIAIFSLVGELGIINFTHLIIYQLFWSLLVLIIPNIKKL